MARKTKAQKEAEAAALAAAEEEQGAPAEKTEKASEETAEAPTDTEAAAEEVAAEPEEKVQVKILQSCQHCNYRAPFNAGQVYSLPKSLAEDYLEAGVATLIA